MTWLGHRFAGVTQGRGEAIVAIVLLAAFVAIRLPVTFELEKIHAFDRFDLFFDADPLRTVAAVRDGRPFNRLIHPGMALLINVPIRVLDLVASATGITSSGTLRSTAPFVLPAICGLLGGVFFWLSCGQVGITGLRRLGGLLLMQGSFSQALFSVIPESFAISGLLLCVLLWAATRAAQRPHSLSGWKSRLAWLMLASMLSAITVTNGALCVVVWLAIQFRSSPLPRWLLQGALALLTLVACVAVMVVADRIAYPPPRTARAGITVTQWVKKFSVEPSAVLRRFETLPADALASIVAPTPELVALSRAPNRSEVGFSFANSAGTWPRMIIAWLVMLGGVAYTWPRLDTSAIARAVAGVLAFNSALHSGWGNEVFLYSQHWLAFLVFGVVVGLNSAPWIGGRLMMGLGMAVALYNAWILAGMTAALRATSAAGG